MNGVFPLFDRLEIETRLNLNEELDPKKDVCWYAALNIVFAVGSLFVQISKQGRIAKHFLMDPTDPNFLESWSYFGNCCSILSDLLFQDTNIVGLSALVAMV